MDCKMADVLPHATGEENTQKLWKLSESLPGEKFA